jgi:hypothetical protein
MKKLILAGMLFGALTVSTFAQLNVGAYAKSNYIPWRFTLTDDGDVYHTTAVQVPWGGPDISSGVNFDGWSQYGGLHLGLDIAYGASNNPGGYLSVVGSGWVWAKPFDFIPLMDSFALYFGTPSDDTLSGKYGSSPLIGYVLNTSYDVHNYRLSYGESQYNIFTRLNPYSWGNADGFSDNQFWPRIGAAFMFTWEPVEHLWIGGFIAPEAFRITGWTDGEWEGGQRPIIETINGDRYSGDDINQDFYDAKSVWKKIQIQAGYDIPGIGLARVQYIGVRNVVEAAFQVKSLGDLVMDIGVKIPFEDTTLERGDAMYKKAHDWQASLAATWRSYDFRVTGRIDTAFGGYDSSMPAPAKSKTHGLDMLVYLIPQYQLKIGAVGADLGFEYEAKDDINGYEEDCMQAGAALWFTRDMGNAKFRAAAVTRLPMPWKVQASRPDKTAFELFFPLTIEIGF